MQILASITFPRFDLEEDRAALTEAVYHFGERPTLESFKQILQIMGNEPQSVPFGDSILMRVSMNEQIDVKGTVQFASVDHEIIETCTHCGNKTNSDKYDMVHN
jgi:hypothetical protein